MAYTNIKLNYSIFLERAIQRFGNRYDYSKSVYTGFNKPLKFICPDHGEVTMYPSSHLKSRTGCPYCSGVGDMNNELFIKRSKDIHGDKYDYGKVDYINQMEHVTITCKKHGDFTQAPVKHLHGHGCPSCGHLKSTVTNNPRRVNRKKFVERCNRIYNNYYDYSLVPEIFLLKETVKIICPKHGVFECKAKDHLERNRSCTPCNQNWYDHDKLIKKFRSVHGDKYNYKLNTGYIKTTDKIDIICKKHGLFKQNVASHIQGCGCPGCHNSHMEDNIMAMLQSIGIQLVREKTFDWLKYKKHQKLDIFIPSMNIAIECQGMQHFIESGTYFLSVEEQMLRDSNKFTKCAKHGIEVIYYYPKTKDTPDEYLGKSFHTIEDLKNYILQKQSEQ